MPIAAVAPSSGPNLRVVRPATPPSLIDRIWTAVRAILNALVPACIRNCVSNLVNRITIWIQRRSLQKLRNTLRSGQLISNRAIRLMRKELFELGNTQQLQGPLALLAAQVSFLVEYRNCTQKALAVEHYKACRNQKPTSTFHPAILVELQGELRAAILKAEQILPRLRAFPQSPEALRAAAFLQNIRAAANL